MYVRGGSGISKPLDALRAAFRRITVDESAAIFSHTHSNTSSSKSAALDRTAHRSPLRPPIFSPPGSPEVVYTVSPMKVGVMGGLFKDFGNVMTKKLMGWTDMALSASPPPWASTSTLSTIRRTRR